MARTNFKVFDIREVGCRLNQMRLKELTLENNLVSFRERRNGSCEALHGAKIALPS